MMLLWSQPLEKVSFVPQRSWQLIITTNYPVNSEGRSPYGGGKS